MLFEFESLFNFRCPTHAPATVRTVSAGFVFIDKHNCADLTGKVFLSANFCIGLLLENLFLFGFLLSIGIFIPGLA